MSESQEILGPKLLIAWAAASTVFAIIVTIMLVASVGRKAPSQARPSATESPFLALKEEDLVGRYKWIDGGVDKGVVELRADHSFLAPGERKPAVVHQWDIGRDALLLGFYAGVHRFTNIESAGIFTGHKVDGTIVRIEKIP